MTRTGGETGSRYKGLAALPRWLLMGVVYAYRYLVSPIIGPRCRYLPTCSDYALEALRTHGAWKGSLLSLKRIGRCHPWTWLGGGSGYDPVPDAEEENGSKASQ